MSRKNILFLQPIYFDPTQPNFADKFEMLSSCYDGHVFFMSDQPMKYDGIKVGNFIYHAVPYYQNKVKRYFYQMATVVRIAARLHKERKIDIIYAYDPIALGFIGIFLKQILRAWFVVEINGHFRDPVFLNKRSFFFHVKRLAALGVARWVIRSADVIKCLNDEQRIEWAGLLKGKKVAISHDFVPTHAFSVGIESEPYIFFIGHPFYLKGIDVLIKAFLKVSSDFPWVKLKVVGHCHGGDAERQKYIDMAQGNPNIEILKPVYYKEAIKLFEQCLFFVLPSRSEAMGRVLIEAMSTGKPVIGSRVGGIPDVIEDGGNGFLFESENVADLAEKLRQLLKSQELRGRMGARSLELVEQKFSSQKYVENFTRMIEGQNE